MHHHVLRRTANKISSQERWAIIKYGTSARLNAFLSGIDSLTDEEYDYILNERTGWRDTISLARFGLIKNDKDVYDFYAKYKKRMYSSEGSIWNNVRDLTWLNFNPYKTGQLPSPHSWQTPDFMSRMVEDLRLYRDRAGFYYETIVMHIVSHFQLTEEAYIRLSVDADLRPEYRNEALKKLIA